MINLGSIFDHKGKSVEQLLEEMFKLAGEPATIFEALKMATQVRIWDQMFDTITETRKEFIDQTKTLRESINQFRKSTERSSKALNWFTLVIAATGLLTLGLLIYRAICP